MDFYSRYKAYEDERLLKIVGEDREGYQTEAIEAAEQILQERGVSIPEIKVVEESEMSVESEIQYRLENGESIEMISLDMKNRGVEGTAMYDEKIAEDIVLSDDEKKSYKTYQRKLFRVLGFVFIILTLYRFVVFMDTKYGFHLFGVITGLILTVYFFSRSRAPKEMVNHEKETDD